MGGSRDSIRVRMSSMNPHQNLTVGGKDYTLDDPAEKGMIKVIILPKGV